MARFDPATQIDAMFDLVDTTDHSAEHAPKRAAKSVAWVSSCPDCTATELGVVRAGTHLFYREHAKATWGGTRIQCRASNTALCDNPPAFQPYNQDVKLPLCHTPTGGGGR